MIAIAYFIIEKKKAAPQPWQAIAQRFCSIGSYGFNFLQIISFRIIHTTTKTATKAPSNSNSVYHGADCMAYKFG